MMPGATAAMASYPRPRRSMGSGRIESTNTSASPATRNNAAWAAGCRRSSTRLRLLRLTDRWIGTIEGPRVAPMCRMMSPCGLSTLITSATMSPKIWVAYGPITTLVKSTTLNPESAPGILVRCPLVSLCRWFLARAGARFRVPLPSDGRSQFRRMRQSRRGPELPGQRHGQCRHRHTVGATYLMGEQTPLDEVGIVDRLLQRDDPVHADIDTGKARLPMRRVLPGNGLL